MKYVVGAFLAVVIGAVLATPDEEKYTTKYDNVNLDEIFANERLVDNYMNCLLDKGNCTPDGQKLKEAIPDALTNDCSKCSEKQKKGAEKVIKFLKEKKKEKFEELMKKYDPNGVYQKKYGEHLAKLK